jgi:RHS repeat-associated protein
MTMVYDAVGNAVAQVDARGNRTTYAYDALNRQTTRTDSLSHTTTTVYDAAGNVARAIDAGGYTTTYVYDGLNRRTTAQDPGGAVATSAYDAVGNLIASTDALNHTTMFSYDGLNRQTKAQDALGGVTSFAYDAAGNRTLLVDADGNRTTFAYDAANRLTQQTNPLNNNATFAYDAAGRQTSMTDGLGRRRDQAYDANNRETGETWVNADTTVAQRVTYTYDADGNLTSAANGNGAYTYSYDAVGRQTVVQEPFGLTLTYAYDAVGSRTALQDSKGGVTTYAYDAVRRLTQVQLTQNAAAPLRMDLTYTSRDQVDTEIRYSDLTGSTKVGSTTYAYDAVSRVRNLQHRDGSGNVLANYTYTYDLAGRLTSQTENAGSPTTYTYDATNQLTGDGTSTHTYDLNGNRTDTGYSTTANEVTTDGTWTYTYDAEGNVTKKSKGANAETWTFGYDLNNQMVWAQDRATDGGTLLQIATYAYDTEGHRLEKSVTSNGTTTTSRYGYLDDNAWADLDNSNAIVTRRLFGNEFTQLLARESAAGTAAWYYLDRQNSVRLLANASGILIDTVTYDGYGKQVSESAPSSGDDFSYIGCRLDDETGFLYTWWRYIDLPVFRFTSRDPLGFGAGDTNLYRYVRNRPLDGTDPSGLRDSTPAPFAGVTMNNIVNPKVDPQNYAITGVGEVPVEDVSGPDVTEWFAKDLIKHILYRRTQQEDWWKKYEERNGLAGGVVVGDAFMVYCGADLFNYKEQAAHLMNYKWMSFTPDGTGMGKNTVVLAGEILRKNQLGNIALLVVGTLLPVQTPGKLTPWTPTDIVEYVYVDKPAVSTYLKTHPHASNYGVFKGLYRADNLAAFGVGTAIARNIEKIPGWDGRKTSSKTMKEILTVDKVKECITKVLGDADAFKEATLTYKQFLPKGFVTMDPKVLTFIPEYGVRGFNTNDLKTSKKVYNGPSSIEYWSTLQKMYEQHKADHLAWFGSASPFTSIDDYLRYHHEDYKGGK